MENLYIDGQFIRERITRLRLEKGVSEREMSLSLGMCESYIRNITTAPSLPSMDSFLNICEYLGIAPSDFFDPEMDYPLTGKEAAHELERLFGSHLPEFIEWLAKLERTHADIFLDAMRRHAPPQKAARRRK